MTLIAKTSDSITGTPFDPFNGVTLDNTLGGSETNTWVASGWTYNSLGTQAQGSSGSIAYPTPTAAVGIQRVSAVLGNFAGIVARYVPADGSHFLIFKDGSDLELYYYDGSLHLLDAAVGACPAGTETLAISCNGTTIKGQVNGVDVITQTHASNPTGVGGMRTYGGSFLYEVDDGSGGGSPVVTNVHTADRGLNRALNRGLSVG